ncbi:unnamed protein product [Miscanthus lutarioriparius]|uniref:Chalcone-flavonone isomerase family protein n=1 Tax=Miscanthus lutarioriparius TaxID=422564 RepID=A0A811PMZ0_9POAL|nr:unnamed protein product [Miscanthus lutarioriparius]
MGSAQPIGTDSAQARLQHSSLLGFGRLGMQRSPLMETLQIRPRASFATHQRSPVSTSLRSLIAGRAATTNTIIASLVFCHIAIIILFVGINLKWWDGWLVVPSSMKRIILATVKSTEDLILGVPLITVNLLDLHLSLMYTHITVLRIFGDAFVTEDTTNVKFLRELTVPGYTYPLVAVGTGYRDKFFVKVYAAAFYVDYSLRLDTEQWKEKIGIESFDGSSVFDSIFKAPVVKSLSIILVRAVDGKTFVNALNDVIARQIKNPNAEEESSLSTLQNTFLGRNLKQGTSIYLTWLEPKRMLIIIQCVAFCGNEANAVTSNIENSGIQTVNMTIDGGSIG